MSERVHDGNVVALHPFTEEQALADLCALGRTRLRNCELAQRWQWHRNSVERRIKRWSKDKLIFRRRGIITAVDAAPRAPTRPDAPRRAALGPGLRPHPALVQSISAAPAPMHPPAALVQEVAQEPGIAPSNAPVQNSHKWLGAFAVLLGCATAAVGLGWSIMSLARGHVGDGGWLMIAVCIVIELIAIGAPSFGTALWGMRHRAISLAIWTGYAAAMAMVIFNGIGFAGMQIGDAVAGRAGVIGTATDLRGELDARLLERSGLKFAPADPSQIETAEGERDRACDNGKRTCAELDAKVAALGKQRAVNERLAAIDAVIKDIRGKLAVAPAVASADPQVESTMQVLALASVAPPKHAIEVGRLLGLVLIPCVMGGLLLPAGMLLWQGRRA